MARIILDTDIGSDVDDAVALALALRSPEIDLRGVTTVYGDVNVRSKIVLKMMKLAGQTSIPVRSGVSAPLLRQKEVWWAGHEGEGILTEEDEALHVSSEHAVDFIINTVMAEPKQVALVAIGPLTNIALAIIKEPRIIDNVKELIIMGGAVRTLHNAPALPVAEHNIKCDPDAAQVVFTSGIPLTMVGLDVTTQIFINRNHLRRIEESDTPLNLTLGRLIRRWWQFLDSNSSHMHDPLAISLLLDRSLCRTECYCVKVECQGIYTTGQTLIDPQGEANVDVAVDVDGERFLALLMDRLCGQD